MYLICGNRDLRKELVQKLGLSVDQQTNRVFSSFTVLPSLGNVAIAVNDLTDGNLRFVIRYFLANVSVVVIELGLYPLRRLFRAYDPQCLGMYHWECFAAYGV
ncbi:unnamed protein product [Heligmosomoides polygyrus]|uniref:Na_H_Exchanger domain-containing protein n=1 Tax=Heligmosomoides polygyrus TaxID=6339 RepID=A0A183GCE2_HELPZ|nr:unnamed protein product [Heligmosomoides polygyrus]